MNAPRGVGSYVKSLLTYLLQFSNDVLVAHEPLPRQQLDLGSHPETVGVLTLEERLRLPSQCFPLRHKVPLNQGEHAVRKQVGTDVEVASISGAEGEGLWCEAVLRDVCVGCGQDGALGGGERPSRVRVVVRMVRATMC